MDIFCSKSTEPARQPSTIAARQNFIKGRSKKSLTDDAASASAARLALFWCHSVRLNKQILRKVYRTPKWKVVGGDKSCQWAPHIPAGGRRRCKWLRAKEVCYGSRCFQPPLEARLNHLAPKSLEYRLERATVTGSTLGVSLIIRLDTNDLFADIGSLAAPNLEWHFPSRTCLPKHERAMAIRK